MRIVYIGNLGSGKTLTALYMSLLLYREYRKIYPGYKIYSNIRLKLDQLNIDWEYFNKETDLDNINYGVVLFDEMWKWCDSRLSGSNLNRFLSSWSVITRKRKLSLLVTEQYEKMLDKRIREITNYIAYPRQENYSEELTQKFGEPTYLNTTCIYIPVNNSGRKIFQDTIYNPPLFELFDTTEEPEEFGETFEEYFERFKREVILDGGIFKFERKSERLDYICEKFGVPLRKARIVYRMVLDELESEESE